MCHCLHLQHHCPVYVHTVLRKGWVTGLAWVDGDSRMLVCVTENGVAVGIFPAVFGLEAKYRTSMLLLERPGHFWDAQVTRNLVEIQPTHPPKEKRCRESNSTQPCWHLVTKEDPSTCTTTTRP